MRVLTANRSILTTRNVTWRHVPPSPAVLPKRLLPIVEEGESTARQGESGEGTSSQGGGRVEVDLDGESDLDVTVVGHVLPAIRKTQTAEAGAGVGGVAEGDSPSSSVSSGRADNGSSSSSTDSSSSNNSNCSNSSSSGSGSSSSSSNTGNGDDKSGSSTSSGDVPTLTGREAHRQRWNDKIPALQGGRTRSQSRQYQMNAYTPDALLAHAQRTVEEDTAIKRERPTTPPVLSTCPLHTNSGCGKERRISIGPW